MKRRKLSRKSSKSNWKKGSGRPTKRTGGHMRGGVRR